MPTFKIKISKAKADMEVDWDALPANVQQYIVEQGLSKVLNAATAKETKDKTPDNATREANAMALAAKRLDGLKEGKTGTKKSSDSKVPGKVMTEARRLAKQIVKQAIKAGGGKVSDYTAAQITEAANLYITQHQEIIQKAEANIKAADDLAGVAAADISGLKADPKLVAKREAENAAKRAATEAKNAGKPGGQASATKKQAGKPTPVRAAPPAKPAPAPAPTA